MGAMRDLQGVSGSDQTRADGSHEVHKGQYHSGLCLPEYPSGDSRNGKRHAAPAARSQAFYTAVLAITERLVAGQRRCPASELRST